MFDYILKYFALLKGSTVKDVTIRVETLEFCEILYIGDGEGADLRSAYFVFFFTDKNIIKSTLF